jgi:hypothetical protein
VLLLHGDPVIAITEDAVRIRTRSSGALLNYYRRALPDSVPLWELTSRAAWPIRREASGRRFHVQGPGRKHGRSEDGSR